jgi:DNA repair protein RadC
MEVTLSEKCGQCHILEYIFSHQKWVEEDVLHAFNRMQMDERESFTEEEQDIIDLFKEFQLGDLNKGKLSEFASLKGIGEKDVIDMTEKVYTNNCVPCHNPSKMEKISLQYSKARCKNIVDRMREKEPTLFLDTDMDRLANYLWEIKSKPFDN